MTNMKEPSLPIITVKEKNGVQKVVVLVEYITLIRKFYKLITISILV